MTKFLALSAAAVMAVAPLTLSAEEAVRLETDKASQSQILAGTSALAVGTTVLIAGVLFAVVSDSSSSSTSTTLVRVSD